MRVKAESVQAIQRGGGHRNDRARAAGSRGQDQRTAVARRRRWSSSTAGNGPGGGASKLTGDVTHIISQLPPVLESLTGVKFEKLLEQVPALKKAMGKDDDKDK